MAADGIGHAAVIGTGAAGSAAARDLARAGWRVTVVERDRVGGTCLWRGCIPKKSLYHSATLLRTLRDADRFGVNASACGFDWQTVLAWKWHAQETYAGDQEGILANLGIELVRGDARFGADGAVEVDGRALPADHVVIATGSRSIMPPIPGIGLADTSDDALRYPEPPETLLVVGGGFIALELAAIYSAFGTRVTVVTKAPRVLEMIDEELADTAASRLSAEGVRFVSDATVAEIRGEPGRLEAVVESGTGASGVIETQRVLMAVGRVLDVDGLDVANAGVEVDSRGRLVLDEHLRTTNPRVWAAGDAAGSMMQTPVANLMGHTVARSIISGTPQECDLSAMPVTCFTFPQLASVGITEAEAASRGIEVAVRRTEVEAIGAGVVAGETSGFFKFVCAADDGRILGAQCAAPNASDLIYPAALAVSQGLTAEEIGRVVAVHPSFAEAVGFSGG